MLLIGIDGGGTSTAACLAEWDQKDLVPIGRGSSGTSNLVTAAEETALGHLDEAIDAAFRDAGRARTQVESLCAALAGSDRDVIRQRVLRWAIDGRVARTVDIVHDAEPLLADVDRSMAAVALIAGTGSFAFGRAADGRTVRVGGWGPMLGDEGSAYWMGLEALRCFAQVIDGRAEGTTMYERLVNALAMGDQTDFVSRVGTMDRQSIAALAKLVDQSADDGDLQANAICLAAAGHLMEIVSAVVNRLTLPPTEFALVVTGGVLLNRSVVSRLFQDQLVTSGMAPSSIRFCDDPAWGAVQLACFRQRT